MPTVNPFPFDFILKENSPELEAFFAQFGKKFYIDAEESNNIYRALIYLYENMGSSNIVDTNINPVQTLPTENINPDLLYKLPDNTVWFYNSATTTWVNVTKDDNTNITSVQTLPTQNISNEILYKLPDNTLWFYNATSLTWVNVTKDDNTNITPVTTLPTQNINESLIYRLPNGDLFIRVGSGWLNIFRASRGYISIISPKQLLNQITVQNVFDKKFLAEPNSRYNYSWIIFVNGLSGSQNMLLGFNNSQNSSNSANGIIANMFQSNGARGSISNGFSGFSLAQTETVVTGVSAAAEFNCGLTGTLRTGNAPSNLSFCDIIPTIKTPIGQSAAFTVRSYFFIEKVGNSIDLENGNFINN